MSTTADAFVVKLVYATGTASPGRTHCLQDTMHRTFCGRYVDEGESFEGRRRASPVGPVDAP